LDEDNNDDESDEEPEDDENLMTIDSPEDVSSLLKGKFPNKPIKVDESVLKEIRQ